MISADLDHDGHTQPSNDKPPIEPIPLDRLRELTFLALALPGGRLLVETETVIELVRVYRIVRNMAESVDRIGQIGEALERQIEVAETAAEGQLRRAGQRFEILLHWGEETGLFRHVKTDWHCTDAGLRWAGSFDEAIEIVRTSYGPKRGTNAYVVVRVPE